MTNREKLDIATGLIHEVTASGEGMDYESPSAFEREVMPHDVAVIYAIGVLGFLAFALCSIVVDAKRFHED